MPAKFRGPLLVDYMRALKAAERFDAPSVRIDIGEGAITINLKEADETPAPAETASTLPQWRPVGRRRVRAAAPPGEQLKDVILGLLQKGPTTLQQMRDALVQNGHSAASVGTGLDALKPLVERTGVGVYALKPAEPQAPHNWKVW